MGTSQIGFRKGADEKMYLARNPERRFARNFLTARHCVLLGVCAESRKTGKKGLADSREPRPLPFFSRIEPFRGVRAPPESDERRRIRSLSHRTAPPRPRKTDRTPRRTRNISFARSRHFYTRLILGGSGNVASKNRLEEGSGEVWCRQLRARSCPARRRTRQRWTPGASARTCGTSATRSAGWMNSSPPSRTGTR